MGTYKFTFKYNQFLSIILSLSLVITSLPAWVIASAYLTAPGSTEVSHLRLDFSVVDGDGAKLKKRKILIDDKFINRITKRKVTSPAQRIRIKKIIEYFWQHEGLASPADLTHYVGDNRNYIGWTYEAIYKDLCLDLIDFYKLETESKKLKKPIPIYCINTRHKNRLLNVIEITESLGYRASIAELIEVFGFKNNGMVLHIFMNCKNSTEAKLFVEKINYNRNLNGKLPLQFYYSKKTKEVQDKLINALEAFNGRATSEELAKILEIAPRNVNETAKKINFKELNKKRRADGEILLIGVIHKRTKRVQDEIIYALECFGGVASPKQIAEYIGQNPRACRKVLSEMDFELINEIREKRGLVELFVVGGRSQEKFRKMLKKKMKRKIDKGSDTESIVNDTLALYDIYFGNAAIKAFRNITIPFIHAAVYRNGNDTKKKTAKQKEWLRNIFQYILICAVNYAKEQNLINIGVEQGRKGRGVSLHYRLINYFRISVPRAVNISREEISEIDVSRINLSFRPNNKKNGRDLGAKKLSREPHIKSFLQNLAMANAQLNSKQTLISLAGESSIIFEELDENGERIKLARVEYEKINSREKERFNNVKKAVERLNKSRFAFNAETVRVAHTQHMRSILESN